MNEVTYTRLMWAEWALVNLLDGVDDHEIQRMTGMTDCECEMIASVRRAIVSNRGTAAFKQPDGEAPASKTPAAS